MSSPRNAHTLRHLLEAALIVAAASSAGSCCEIVSLGWSRSYSAERQTQIRRLDSSLAARVGSHGGFDSDTCELACKRPDDGTPITGCEPVSIAFEKRAGRFVHCSSPVVPYEHWRAIDDRTLAQAEADRRTAESSDAQGEIYERVCGPLPDRFNSNVHQWRPERPPLVPEPSERFVVCHYEKPGGCGSGVPSGRRPRGLDGAFCAPDAASLGAHFASVAHLEAASVVAFRHLALDLREHGAPRSLVRRAERAHDDEIRHARTMARLARREGAAPRRLPRLTRRSRSLVEIAIENVVEGCVGETLGAAIAMHQARAASDPSLRRIMQGIARDELRHAALAWSVADWARTRLDHAERRSVDEAMRGAARTHIDTPIHASEDAIRTAGVPDPAQAARIARALSIELWDRPAHGCV